LTRRASRRDTSGVPAGIYLMRRFALPFAMALALATLVAAPALAQRAGNFQVRGTNPDGTDYTGNATMRQVGIVSWQIIWDVGGNRIEGIGMSSGSTFAVTYRIGNVPGMGIYEILADGSMTGQWTAIGSTAIGTETLTPR
jgi:hypothetical protein